MTTFPNSPRLLKGGIVILDAETSAVTRTIVLQYNPETLTRTLQVKAPSGEGERADAVRLAGVPIETIKLDAEIDATDQLEFPDQNATTIELGIHPQLAALEALVYPTSGQLQTLNTLANLGTLEIAPPEAPLTLFVWSKHRILPVRLTDFSIIEESFDALLNPLRAKVSLGMHVLSVADLKFDHKGASVFMAYLTQKERLAAINRTGSLSSLGITQIP